MTGPNGKTGSPLFLSVVVPVRNEARYIEATLRMLIGQDYDKDRYEILVIDGHSDDETKNIVGSFIQEHPDRNIRLLDNPGRLSSRARNIGAREAAGELVAVIDGHVFIPGDQLFRAMEDAVEGSGAVCLARPAPLDIPGMDRNTGFWVAKARKTWLAHSRNSFIYGTHRGFVNPMSSGFAYKKELFQKIGYFDERFDAAEDVEFHYRLWQAGVQAYTAPELLIYYYPRTSMLALFRQQTRYGEGRARLTLKHPESLTKETLIPPAILLYVAFLPLGLFLVGAAPLPGMLYLAGLAFYLSVLVLTGAVEALRERSVAGLLKVPLAIFLTHTGLGWGFLKTLFIHTFRRDTPGR